MNSEFITKGDVEFLHATDKEVQQDEIRRLQMRVAELEAEVSLNRGLRTRQTEKVAALEAEVAHQRALYARQAKEVAFWQALAVKNHNTAIMLQNTRKAAEAVVKAATVERDGLVGAPIRVEPGRVTEELIMDLHEAIGGGR